MHPLGPQGLPASLPLLGAQNVAICQQGKGFAHASAVSGGLPTRYLTPGAIARMVAPVMCRPSSEAKKSNALPM